MRVLIVTESFLPHMNGVTNSVLHVINNLESRGHETFLVSADHPNTRHEYRGATVPSVALPSYPAVRLGTTGVRKITRIIEDFEPDVVHLASPFVLGWQGIRAARAMGVPTVAVYQTDVPRLRQRYRIPFATDALSAHLARLHNAATLNLVPSAASFAHLDGLGVGRLRQWARGIDGERFRPERRSESWRKRVAPNGETIIGYVGRLAPEKQVEDLVALADIDHTKLVIVGDGPSRAELEKALPQAVFLGFQNGMELAESVAGFDIFVHPGERESFGQTIQEALVSGVPVVATGVGGPVDLVQSSRTGWLYRPGDLSDLRARVLDLVGDSSKRRAFAEAARPSVVNRTWASMCDQLVGHYRDAVTMQTAGDVRFLTSERREDAAAAATPRPKLRTGGWSRYVAVGDSLTEGLCDDSRQKSGQYRGWADRLAHLLGQEHSSGDGLRYANLAVRSRRIRHAIDEQIPRAIELKADLVTVLIGGNDLVKYGARPTRLAAQLGSGLQRLRDSGADVLVVTAFTPPHPLMRPLRAKFAAFNRELRALADGCGVEVLDFWNHPEFLDLRVWSADRVHMSSRGHRLLAYRAAERLGVPSARELGELEVALHEPDGETLPDLSTPDWLWQHVRPWAGRRLRGRTAGDGLSAKHAQLVLQPRRPSGDARVES